MVMSERPRNLLKNMNELNLSRLTAALIHPDRQLTKVDKMMGEYVMGEIRR